MKDLINFDLADCSELHRYPPGRNGLRPRDLLETRERKISTSQVYTDITHLMYGVFQNPIESK